MTEFFDEYKIMLGVILKNAMAKTNHLNTRQKTTEFNWGHWAESGGISDWLYITINLLVSKNGI